MENRKSKRPSSQKQKASRGPIFYKNPLSDIPREELIPALIERGKASKVRFRDSLDKVLAVLRTTEPLQTIATLTVYGLFTSITPENKIAPLIKDWRFGQAQVELAQALSLTIPSKDSPDTPPQPIAIQQLFDMLPELGESFTLQRMVVMEQARSDQQKAVILLQELLRMHTQNVRNWGYFDQVKRIVCELYKPLDNAFVECLGITVTQLVAAFSYLLRNAETKVNARWKQLSQIFSKRSVSGMVRQYLELNPDLMDCAEDLLAFATRKKFSVKQMKWLILAHSDFRLVDVFRFSTASMAAILGVSEVHIAHVLGRLSLAFGDLASHQCEYLFLDNPVWRKPVINVGQDEYFCAIPQVFFSFVRPILDDLIEGNQQLMRACEDRRADFLESELARLFAHAFPGAEMVAGFRWVDGDKQYENDLLVRIDSHLFLVEAKSGTISWPALRGAPDRAKRHIEDLFIAPSVQSARLAERIKAVVKSPELRASYLPGLDLRLERVHTVLRLSVTLEDFAMTQANLHALRDTGWLPPEHALAPCILFTDLEIVFDILEAIGQKIHYLRRRAELATTMATMGDELDHLGFYLTTGFNVGDAEFGGVRFQLIDMSKEVDDYCAARAEGIQEKKPRLRLSKWWSDICTTLEQRSFYQWTDANNILLSFSSEEQENAERMFKKVKKNVRANWRNPSHECSVVVIPHFRKSNALALFAYREEDKNTRRERMQAIASQVFTHPHVARCLVLGINIDKEMYPYATLAVFLSEDVPAQGHAEDIVVY